MSILIFLGFSNDPMHTTHHWVTVSLHHSCAEAERVCCSPLYSWMSLLWMEEWTRPSGSSLRYSFSKLATVQTSASCSRSTSSPLSSLCFRLSTARTLALTRNKPSCCSPDKWHTKHDGFIISTFSLIVQLPAETLYYAVMFSKTVYQCKTLCYTAIQRRIRRTAVCRTKTQPWQNIQYLSCGWSKW